MLFNSYLFLFLFLPLTLAGLVLVRRHAPRRGPVVWLLGASLVFFAVWHPPDLLVLLGSIAVNFSAGRLLARERRASRRIWLLAVAVVLNLAALGYFKYAAFLAANVNALLGTELSDTPRVLPLAISFFTFQQIAFLVDVHRGATAEPNPFRYGLFVSFFPQLIAGPIVHHREMMPQFDADRASDRDDRRWTRGLTTL